MVAAAITFSQLINLEIFGVRGNDSEIVNCDYYFDENNGYTSIYEIVSDLNSSSASGTYKTWGTVTKYYQDSSNYNNFYMQSTDKNGHVAGIMIYRSNLAVSEGNVVTVIGSPTLYNNLPEFVNPSIELDYTANSSPVTTYITDGYFWKNGTDRNSSEFIAAQRLGVIKISMQDVLLSYVSSGNATATFGGFTSVPLYYSFLGGSSTTDINNVVITRDGQTVDIIGYLHCFDNGYDVKMQCLIRSSSDIVGETINSSLTLSSTNYPDIGNYDTGNYDQVLVSGFYFEHYRAVEPGYSDPEFMILLPYVNQYGDGSAPGALYNMTAINDIESISITYRTETSSGDKPTLSYGSNPLCESEVELNLSTDAVTYTKEVSDVDYFKIETSENVLYIHSIEIDYANEGPAPSFDYLSAGNDQVRINPVTSSGALYEGKSVTVPASVSHDGTYYTVQSTKTYTYYSYSYISSYPGLASSAAYTDPVDVAAFFAIFDTYPPNYVVRSSYSSAYSIFGDATRCVSVYSRTDGYATAVPYKTDSFGSPLYYECDIALTSDYSSNNRGVGRVVCWVYGFDPLKGAVNYDDSPTAVYTDDHYATFQEYLNIGSFGTRYNAEMSPTGYTWGCATTLIPA